MVPAVGWQNKEGENTYVIKLRRIENFVLPRPSPSFVTWITFKIIFTCYWTLLNSAFFHLCSNIGRKDVMYFFFDPHVDKEVKNVDFCIVVLCHKGSSTKAQSSHIFQPLSLSLSLSRMSQPQFCCKQKPEAGAAITVTTNKKLTVSKGKGEIWRWNIAVVRWGI